MLPFTIHNLKLWQQSNKKDIEFSQCPFYAHSYLVICYFNKIITNEKNFFTGFSPCQSSIFIQKIPRRNENLKNLRLTKKKLGPMILV